MVVQSNSLPVANEFALRAAEIQALTARFCTEPESTITKEDLVENARTSLERYSLEREQLDKAAPMLARALHMRIEQNGGKDLNAALKREIEKHVLIWCGYGKALAATQSTTKSKGIEK